MKRVFVVVHGIGKQFRGSTARQVALRLGASGKYHDGKPPYLPSQPLGYYHQSESLSRFFPLGEGKLADTHIIETFWANIPQEVVAEGRTLEETKSWAHTVVGRLLYRHYSAMDETKLNALKDKDKIDYTLVAEVLDEISNTIDVLEKLAKIAKPLGVAQVNTRDVLDEFLGDVQIVAEFKTYRERILEQFHQSMLSIQKEHPDAEIHIVAHSEGTVVSFLGLLEAMNGQAPICCDQTKATGQMPSWVKQVRSYVTLGSPIDKHLTLWPDLFKEFKFAAAQDHFKTGQKIKWLNYFDYGDPVGFRLDQTQDWLNDFQQTAAPFEQIQENGFGRYWFPGKAHVDYWNDTELFEHYFEHAVVPSETKDEQPTSDEKLPSRWGAFTFSPLLPFLLSFLLFCAALGCIYFSTYRLLDNVPSDPEDGPTALTIFSRASGMLCLLIGTTIATRIPRLCGGWFWKGFGVAMFALGAVAYRFFADEPLRNHLGSAFSDVLKIDPTIGVITIAALVALFGYWSGMRQKPLQQLRRGAELRKQWKIRRGMIPFILAGVVTVVSLAGYLAFDAEQRGFQPWLQFIAGSIAFFYLWWFATLIFDLALVWLRYVRLDQFSKAEKGILRKHLFN